MSALRVCAVQMAHGSTLDDNLRHARDLLARAAEGGAALALLPEYWFAQARGLPTELAPRAPELRAFLADASRDLGLAVAANLLEASPEGVVRNLGVAYEKGRPALEQAKVHPMPREAAAGVAPGERLAAAPVAGTVAGMLVCADILYPEAAAVLALQRAEVLLNPVMSPWREADPTKDARDALFVARAYDAAAFVVKAGGFRRPADATPSPGGPPPGVAGRSLVAAPWGLLARYRDDFEEELLFADLDLDALRAFRKHKEGFPARRPEAYRDLL